MGVHRHPEYQCFWPRMTTAIHRLVGYPIASLVAERSLTLLLRFVERGGVRRTGAGGGHTVWCNALRSASRKSGTSPSGARLELFARRRASPWASGRLKTSSAAMPSPHASGVHFTLG